MAKVSPPSFVIAATYSAGEPGGWFAPESIATVGCVQGMHHERPRLRAVGHAPSHVAVADAPRVRRATA
jgi:hypothetical protein